MKNKRGIVSFLFVMLMVISSFLTTSGFVLAAEGNGTESSPYLIRKAIDLFNIPESSTSYYKLVNDIDLENIKKEPLGKFCGVLDGNGYSIKNLTIVGAAGASHIALFSKAEDAIFKNLTFENADVTSSYSHTGIITGYAFNTRFENCTVTNSSISGTYNYYGALSGYLYVGTVLNCDIKDVTIKGSNYIASLIGHLEIGTISKCNIENVTVNGGSHLSSIVGSAKKTKILNSNVIDSEIKGSGNTIGSIVGYISEDSTIKNCIVKNPKINASYNIGVLCGRTNSDVTIINCSSIDGTINSTHSTYGHIGGLIGLANSNLILKQCYAATEVTASGQYGGGLIGYADNIVDIEQCYALNNIKGKSLIGGLVGGLYEHERVNLTVMNSFYNGTITTTDASGIAGGITSSTLNASNLTLKNSYVASTVTSKTKYAFAPNGTFTDSYFDENLMELTTPTNQARDTSMMYTEVNYTWDFDTIWTIDEGNDYPKLRLPIDIPNPEEPSPESSTLKMILEPTEQLKLSIDEDINENSKVQWTSSDTSIAEVNSNGIVKAIARGNTTIIAKTSDGYYEETINVYVVDNASKYRLTIDLEVLEKCRVSIDDGKDTTPVTWAVLDSSVATIDKGRVTAVAKGLTIITATNEDGKALGQVYLRVR